MEKNKKYMFKTEGQMLYGHTNGLTKPKLIGITDTKPKLYSFNKAYNIKETVRTIKWMEDCKGTITESKIRDKGELLQEQIYNDKITQLLLNFINWIEVDYVEMAHLCGRVPETFEIDLKQIEPSIINNGVIYELTLNGRKAITIKKWTKFENVLRTIYGYKKSLIEAHLVNMEYIK